ncbi:MAG: heavy metal-binding domain-containing protein, partial [Holophagae bacterium]
MTEIRDSGFGIRKWRSVAVGAMWLLVGVGLTLFLVADPIGVSPVDEWMGIHHESTGGNPASPEGFAGTGGIGLWTCGMHPEVLQDEPGMCPICQMDLVPVGDPASPEGSAGTSGGGDSSWTCPMHPMIEEEDPGECPICGMELVQNVESGGQERAVTIDPAVVQTMNVSIEQVVRRDLTRSIRTVGHLDYDQEAMVSVTTRYSGFVERVFADSVGQKVRRGEPLFEV